MDSTFSRISENVLFSILIAVVAGWMVLPGANDRNAPSSSPPSKVAHFVAASGHS